MIKKLRLKFILINMIIVSIMLTLIFGLLYYSTSQNLERESIQMMKNLSSSPARMAPPGDPQMKMHLPYFSVTINQEGVATDIEGNFFDLSDTEKINEILSASYATNSDSGVLKEYKLRFLRSNTPMGSQIVFVDMVSEESTLHNLIRTFLLFGIAAFLVFLCISIFLARWAVKPVQKAWDQQKQFIADASHELKTPLSVIMTDAELLQAPDCPDEDIVPLSEGIHAMSLQMSGLVENLLDLARIDNGSVKESFEEISFSDIVSEATMIFEPVFFEKGLPLKTEIEPDIKINGISSHLKQLIGILLDNAGKYASPEGEIVVRASTLGHKKCLLEVSNQGDPMSAEDIENIFKRFYRADKARTMNHSYGLGLSIAQSVAEEHRGRIWAKSKDGFNRFFVELPC